MQQPDLFGGELVPVGPARPRPADGTSGCLPEYVQIEAGVWVMCVFALIPKNGFGHLHFPHYWGGPQEAPHWRVDRHGTQVPDGTFIFTSRAEADTVVTETFPDTSDMRRYLTWVSIPSTDYRQQAAGRRTPRTRNAFPWSWWLVGNGHGGLSRTQARSAVEARRHVRDGIAESFLGEGLTEAQSRRAAGTYQVGVVAGGCTEQEAREAVQAWDGYDHGPAYDLHVRWRRATGRPVNERLAPPGLRRLERRISPEQDHDPQTWHPSPPPCPGEPGRRPPAGRTQSHHESHPTEPK